MAVFKSIVLLALIAVLAVAMTLLYTLYRNDARWFEAPGIGQRLQIYFTTNTARTADKPILPELRTPVFDMEAERLFERVLNAAGRLGWSVSAQDADNQNLRFVVSSPLFNYKDDVFVQVRFIDMKRASLYIESRSRQGKGDLAANASHIQRLLRELGYRQ